MDHQLEALLVVLLLVSLMVQRNGALSETVVSPKTLHTSDSPEVQLASFSDWDPFAHNYDDFDKLPPHPPHASTLLPHPLSIDWDQDLIPLIHGPGDVATEVTQMHHTPEAHLGSHASKHKPIGEVLPARETGEDQSDAPHFRGDLHRSLVSGTTSSPSISSEPAMTASGVTSPPEGEEGSHVSFQGVSEAFQDSDQKRKKRFKGDGKGYKIKSIRQLLNTFSAAESKESLMSTRNLVGLSDQSRLSAQTKKNMHPQPIANTAPSFAFVPPVSQEVALFPISSASSSPEDHDLQTVKSSATEVKRLFKPVRRSKRKPSMSSNWSKASQVGEEVPPRASWVLEQTWSAQPKPLVEVGYVSPKEVEQPKELVSRTLALPWGTVRKRGSGPSRKVGLNSEVKVAQSIAITPKGTLDSFLHTVVSTFGNNPPVSSSRKHLRDESHMSRRSSLIQSLNRLMDYGTWRKSHWVNDLVQNRSCYRVAKTSAAIDIAQDLAERELRSIGLKEMADQRFVKLREHKLQKVVPEQAFTSAKTATVLFLHQMVLLCQITYHTHPVNDDDARGYIENLAVELLVFWKAFFEVLASGSSTTIDIKYRDRIFRVFKYQNILEKLFPTGKSKASEKIRYISHPERLANLSAELLSMWYMGLQKECHFPRSAQSSVAGFVRVKELIKLAQDCAIVDWLQTHRTLPW